MVVAADGLYQCEACSMWYETRDLAERCEAFCREHDACDPEIIAEAVDSGERSG